MSNLTLVKTAPPPSMGMRSPSPSTGAIFAAVISLAGLSIILPTLYSLYALWVTDPLKSIGMVVPLVSFVLILRAWRSLHWEQDVSASALISGLGILALTAIVVGIREQSVMVLRLGAEWSVNFPPYSVVLLAYGIGVVLIFGGTRLLRAAWFPVAFLVFVNPVPHIFNVYVDLPLQRASAHVARAFAMALGQPLTPDSMRLMFTPNFGMFIAPGCNGIRGSVTMGLIALVVGHLYRFRWKAHTLVVVGAVLLGYLFNFLRLCTLVLYYLVALHFPSLQPKGELADYIIGACLFFVAVYLLFTVIEKLRQTTPQSLPIEPATVSEESFRGPGFYLRAAATILLILPASLRVLHGMSASAESRPLVIDQTAMGQFPETLGQYTRVRLWNEDLFPGTLLYHWAEYRPAGPGPVIDIGISPVLGAHDTLICHSARGEDPVWTAGTTFRTAVEPVGFSMSMFNDGVNQSIEATTICNGASCGEYSSPTRTFGFVWSKPHPAALMSLAPERPIPILIKASVNSIQIPAAIARQQLSNGIGSFLSTVDLDSLTQPYRRP